MSITWWEKTIEYKFVVFMTIKKRMFLSPLDGTLEQAGDAIFSANDKWLLIEFKKDQASITSEKSKFISYIDAKRSLSKQDGHHLIIFGSEADQSPPDVKLNCQTYFNGTNRNGIDEILEGGTDFTHFKQYVEAFTKFKKTSKGGGGVTMNDFALVAGVDSHGNISQYLSLSEFQQQLNMEMLHEKEMNRDRGYER